MNNKSLYFLILLCACGINPLTSKAQVSYCSNNCSLTGSFNTAFGSNCLSASPSGGSNTGIGYGALNVNSTGNSNTAVGEECLPANTSGGGNTGVGSEALYSNTQGESNTAMGYEAVEYNLTGSRNTGIGVQALLGLGTGGVAQNDNTGIGYQSGGSSATGIANTSVGSQSLLNNNQGSYNAAFGYAALDQSFGANYITAIGAECMYKNTAGNVTGVGYQALYNNTGSPNEALGYQALLSNTSGNQNDAFGYAALYTNTTGSSNCAVGDEALFTNLTGSYNTGVGVFSLYYSTGSKSSALGYEALEYNTTGINDAFGYQALNSCNSGGDNAAFGALALSGITSGSYNVGMGFQTLHTNSTGNANIAIGVDALYNTTGSDNTAVGSNAGQNNASGSDNTYVGALAGNNYTTGTISNYTALGFSSGTSSAIGNEIDLGNTSITEIRAEVTGITGYSDSRIKDNVKENVPGIEFIKRLRPVTYNLNIHHQNEIIGGGKQDTAMWKGKYDIEKITQTGFIAQEVEQAAKEVGYDFSAIHKPTDSKDLYGLAYTTFVVPLVKGMQEQQQTIESQANTIQSLQDALNSALNGIATQAAQLQTLTGQMQNLQDCCYGSGKEGGVNGNLVPKLLNAAPNPASNTTTIYYYAPENSKTVGIEIKDGSGRSVKTIPASTVGYSSVVAETSNLSSGIYYYSLIVDDQISDTKQLVITLK